MSDETHPYKPELRDINPGVYALDITTLPEGEGEFRCPHPTCSAVIDPEKPEENYTILYTKMKGMSLDELTIECGECKSRIYVSGFLKIRES